MPKFEKEEEEDIFLAVGRKEENRNFAVEELE
jgi:hypothetical protein